MIIQASSYTVEHRHTDPPWPDRGGTGIYRAIRVGSDDGTTVTMIYLWVNQVGKYNHRAWIVDRPGDRSVVTFCPPPMYADHLDLLRNEKPVAVVLGEAGETWDQLQQYPDVTTPKGRLPFRLVALNERVGEGPIDRSNVFLTDNEFLDELSNFGLRLFYDLYAPVTPDFD